MIADFASTKGKLDRLLSARMQKLIRGRNLLGLPRVQTLHEGERLEIVTPERTIVMELEEAQATMTIGKDEMKNLSAKEIVARTTEVAGRLGEQMEAKMMRTITEAVEATGNTISGDLAKDPSVILRAMEEMPIEFDDSRDKPVLPALILSPQLMHRLAEEEARRSDDDREQFQAKMERILDRKYEEYQQREETRRLVD